MGPQAQWSQRCLSALLLKPTVGGCVPATSAETGCGCGPLVCLPPCLVVGALDLRGESMSHMCVFPSGGPSLSLPWSICGIDIFHRITVPFVCLSSVVGTSCSVSGVSAYSMSLGPLLLLFFKGSILGASYSDL